jgi:hypothetical protein
VVANGVPFHSTVDAETNPDPETLTVTGLPPALIEEGVRLVIAGTGFVVGGLEGAVDPLPQPEVLKISRAAKLSNTGPENVEGSMKYYPRSSSIDDGYRLFNKSIAVRLSEVLRSRERERQNTTPQVKHW